MQNYITKMKVKIKPIAVINRFYPCVYYSCHVTKDNEFRVKRTISCKRDATT